MITFSNLYEVCMKSKIIIIKSSLEFRMDSPSFLWFIIFASSDTFWVKHRELRFLRLKKQETILDVSTGFSDFDEMFLFLWSYTESTYIQFMHYFNWVFILTYSMFPIKRTILLCTVTLVKNTVRLIGNIE